MSAPRQFQKQSNRNKRRDALEFRSVSRRMTPAPRNGVGNRRLIPFCDARRWPCCVPKWMGEGGGTRPHLGPVAEKNLQLTIRLQLDSLYRSALASPPPPPPPPPPLSSASPVFPPGLSLSPLFRSRRFSSANAFRWPGPMASSPHFCCSTFLSRRGHSKKGGKNRPPLGVAVAVGTAITSFRKTDPPSSAGPFLFCCFMLVRGRADLVVRAGRVSIAVRFYFGPRFCFSVCARFSISPLADVVRDAVGRH